VSGVRSGIGMSVGLAGVNAVVATPSFPCLGLRTRQTWGRLVGFVY
jgi:hypothetical protein